MSTQKEPRYWIDETTIPLHAADDQTAVIVPRGRNHRGEAVAMGQIKTALVHQGNLMTGMVDPIRQTTAATDECREMIVSRAQDIAEKRI